MINSSQKNESPSTTSSGGKFSNPMMVRGYLTMALLAGSFIGIILISAQHIYFASDNNKKDQASERVFNTTMPLFGTWIGTLIAYYFAKENLDAATENNIRLTETLSGVSNKLESISVSAVISNRFLREYISAVSVSPASGNNQTTVESGEPLSDESAVSAIRAHESTAAETTIQSNSSVTESNGDNQKKSDAIWERTTKEVLERMDKYNRKRMPVFELENTKSQLTGDKLRFLAYYDDISKYCNEDTSATLRNFVSKFPEKNKTFIFVGKNISLAAANRERLKKQGCRDIFVTDSGLPSGEVIGYLTDIDIDQYRSST